MIEWMERLAQVISAQIASLIGPIADFFAGYVWNYPPQAPLLAMVLLGTGLFVTLRLGFIQFRGFRHALGIAAGLYDDPSDEGDLKHYQALTTALSATVGIGNIAGVAIAIRLGGPGALFWMWVTAFFGMALKYAECTLSLFYRNINADGSVSGGPMYYIEMGLGKRWKWMAMLFAGCAVVSSFGLGNMNQSNTMADQMQMQFGIHPIWTAIVCAVFVGSVIIGGIRRIGRVTAVLAPLMATMYCLGALIVLAVYFREIPAGLALIVTEAFHPTSMIGGATGSFLITMMWGIRRGLFSNEAGQGSAPIAHAAARTSEPVREGLVALLEPFIDTLVICSMTGLVIIMTGVWKEKFDHVLPLSSMEALPVSGVVSDQTIGRRIADFQTAKQTVAVQVEQGILRDAVLLSFRAIAEGTVILAADGTPWTGELLIAPSMALTPPAEAKDLTVKTRVLLTGAPLTARGFSRGLPGSWGDIVVTLAVLLFAVSTAISWSYYGDRATEYLLGSWAIPYYRWLFVFIFFLGAILPLEAVWTFGDVAMGLMSFPNLIALIVLSGTVVRLTRDYMGREQLTYKEKRDRAARRPK